MASLAYQFVGELDEDLKCVICLDVAKDPLQHETCGKLFCEECIEQHGKENPCPYCRQGQSHFYLDMRGRRAIQALQVKCTNVGLGCSWEGTVGTLEEHVAICKFSPCPCPNKCTDDENNVKHFMREDLGKHLKRHCPNRKLKCKRCGEKSTYATMTQIHDQVCKKKGIACPNAECNITVQRQGIKRHLEDCVYTEVPCKYHKLGCDVMMKRKDVLRHEREDEYHLHFALDRIATMEEKMDNMAHIVNVNYLKSGESMIFRMNDIELKKDVKEDFYSPQFYTGPRGYCMNIKFYTNGTTSEHTHERTHVLVCPGVLDGKYDHELTWPFVGSVSCEILNQLEDKHHLKKTIAFQPSSGVVAGTFQGYRSFFFIAHDTVKNTQYLKDDALYFRVSVDIPDTKPWLECTAK